MDVIFELQRGETFAIEVGFFDTVLEIKEKIEKYKRIAIHKQTLILNGHTLQDDQNVESCEILHLSRIKLIVAVDKIHLNITVNIPPNQSHFPIEIDPRDTVRRLKERIHEIDAVGPLHRMILQFNAAELQDQRSLRECGLADNSEVEVRLRQLKSKMLKVLVKPKIGETKIPMEVNPGDKVVELKKELQKLQPRMQFHLPAEGFFFIYDQDVMDENRTFGWHGVANGDTIEIFNGHVTGGSSHF